ncbi:MULTISPECIES: hypothetical protein [Frankia]|uniref:hypothetical protein n=1 Tax=Frankia TaxID=1854 RepID=UPI000AA6F10B|nr:MULTISPECIES: hypothetical protein [Frankia]
MSTREPASGLADERASLAVARTNVAAEVAFLVRTAARRLVADDPDLSRQTAAAISEGRAVLADLDLRVAALDRKEESQ